MFKSGYSKEGQVTPWGNDRNLGAISWKEAIEGLYFEIYRFSGVDDEEQKKILGVFKYRLETYTR